MVYIRAKKVKSEYYLYLVKSVWDPKKNTSRQKIIKYLGNASKVFKDDIPAAYRNDSKILSALATYRPANIKKQEDVRRRTRDKMYKKLTEGNIEDCIKIRQEYIKLFDMPSFFDRILRPVMHRIGQDWANGKVSIATEHVASNTAQTLVKIIVKQIQNHAKKHNKRRKVLVCMPVGEEHRLSCDVLETYLSLKGYKVFNMGTHIPTAAILDFIGKNKPDAILVSITLPENIPAGQRLVKKINRCFKIPILVGGYALQVQKKIKFDGKKAVQAVELEEISGILRNV